MPTSSRHDCYITKDINVWLSCKSRGQIKKAAGNMGLEINEYKRKYMRWMNKETKKDDI